MEMKANFNDFSQPTSKILETSFSYFLWPTTGNDGNMTDFQHM